MTSFSYTGAALSNLVGNTPGANVSNLVTLLNDLKTFLNAPNLDGTNIADIPESLLALALQQKLGLNDGGQIGRGKFIQPTGGTTVSATYAAVSNGPDRVASVVLPADGLILVSYSATWFLAGAAVANAAIFVGANQARGWVEDSTTLVAQEAQTSTTKNQALASGQAGLVSTNGAVGNVPAPNTTGQIVGVVKAISGDPFSYGGFTLIEAAAGTYNIDVQFKTSASTLTVANRKLKVLTAGF